MPDPSSYEPSSLFEDTQPLLPPTSLSWPVFVASPMAGRKLRLGEMTLRFNQDPHGTLRLIRESLQLRIKRRSEYSPARAVGMVGLLSSADQWIKDYMVDLEQRHDYQQALPEGKP
jgi:hypothetical protein